MPEITRREALFGVGGAAVGAVIGAGAVGVGVAVAGAQTAPSATAPVRGDAVQASGVHQAGIARPASPQRQTLVQVFDLAGSGTDWVAGVGSVIGELTTIGSPRSSELFPDGAGDLTITVGIGARLSAEAAAALDGGLPSFKQDDTIAESDRGGDVMISACASDPGVLAAAITAVAAALPSATPRWGQRGFRSPGDGTVVRNPIGFLDGIIVPHGDAELESNVWIADGPFAGGTICVLRRLRLRARDFEAMPLDEQEAAIGRRRADGVPLTGGGPSDQVDLQAKTAEGEYLIPLHSHARAAHPSFTGSDLMLRRGYGFDNGITADGIADAGLLFVCFQRSQRTFVATQNRLDEVDDLMKFATPTATASFVVLPGSQLFG